MQGLIHGDPAQDDPAARALANAPALLDLAELHLAWMMRPEAAGYLAALDPETLSDTARRRHRTLSVTLALLKDRQGQDTADLGQAVSWTVGWGQGQALRAAAFARIGAFEEASRLLPYTLDSLNQLSPPIEAALLPDLLEVALVSGNWEVAQALAQRFSVHAELRDSPSYNYLLARASELTGDYLMAFEGYAKAAQGRDGYAQEARLALVRMGRATDSLPLKDAVALLKGARFAWSGDEIARKGLHMLTDLAQELGDREAALWALSSLVRGGPPSQIDALLQRARDIYGSFYRAGAAGEIDLERFLEGHARIAQVWRFDDGFAVQAAGLPERLLEAGMTALAAREFRALREMLEAGGRAEDTALRAGLIARLRQGEARALLVGGRADAAVDLLSGYADGQSGDSEAEALLVEALTQAGRANELATLRVMAQDMGLRRRRAQAFYETGDWAAARSAFLEMWQSHPDQFTFADATRLTLAAYETGDSETLARTAETFPSLAELPGWGEIAGRLGTPAVASGSSGQDDMLISMENADRILDAVPRLTAAEGSP